MRIPRSAATAVFVAVALTLPALTENEARAATQAGVDIGAVVSDAEWVIAAQLPDGAIAHHVDRVLVWPYLANYAAMGLARATEVTGNHRYVDAAWRWLSWYRDHQDGAGFVTDYRVAADGTVESTGDMDSTDAYAGTYLLAVQRAYRADPDRARLDAMAPGIRRARAAIQATEDVDGLTWAKPSWRVKYLMDQSETYAGLVAAGDLALVLGDGTLREQAAGQAQRLAAGVSRLWNPATGAFDWAVHENGARQTTNWSVFYPDAQQQMWAVAFGLANGRRAVNILYVFQSTHPNWAWPTATARYDSGPAPVGYWPVTGWAFARMGWTQFAQAGAGSIRQAALATDRAWPFTPGNAGQLIDLDSAMVPLAVPAAG